MNVRPPGQGSVVLDVEKLPVKEVVRDGLANVFGEARRAIEDSKSKDVEMSGVGQRSLEDVLQYESTALAPDVKDLFNRVALAVAGVAA